MAFMRAFLFVLLCTVQAGHAAPAGPPVSPPLASISPNLVQVARKGTRLYTPEDAGAAPAAPSDAGSQATSSADALEQCMSTWDAGTHISKSRWREICKRQLQEDTTKTPYGGDVQPSR
jgi:hypothetical protein